ncbi:hypothetical protein PR048_005354 [Dryococelus australis]|uniref:Uncharacterized protein n=1 Tax=Dryococelus australis TaxID=614101 RepID=A0ABQ9I800_9NEOP|nr:hypothetical protein PR048_005354 [Dryococelus australis]
MRRAGVEECDIPLLHPNPPKCVKENAALIEHSNSCVNNNSDNWHMCPVLHVTWRYTMHNPTTLQVSLVLRKHTGTYSDISIGRVCQQTYRVRAELCYMQPIQKMEHGRRTQQRPHLPTEPFETMA